MAAFPEPRREQFLERPLPSSEESERAILGAILLDNGLITQAVEFLKPEDFYSPLHRRIYGAMVSLFDASQRIDPILIGEELKKDGSVESIGGVAAITNLTYGLPHFTDVKDYIRVVKEKSTMRSLIRACNEITSEALEEEEDAQTILDRAEQHIFNLAEQKEREGFAHFQPVAERVFEKIQEFAKRESHALTGLATGFRDLDIITSGLQPADLIIIAARPSMGKCLTADSEILEANGAVSTIEEIFHRRAAELITLQSNFRFATTHASDFIDSGVKPVFRVVTRLGRQVETTFTHPFLTVNGWRKLEELRVGDKIAVPRVLRVFGKDVWPECNIKILAYLLGDGCLTKRSPEFTVGKDWLMSDFIDSVREFGGVEAVPSSSPDRTLSLRIRKTGRRSNSKNPLTLWLEDLEIWGCNSHTKFIPRELFTLESQQIALFLNRLFSTDGWASILATGQVQLGYSSVSERLIRQVHHLLLRFGIISALRKRSVKYKESRRTAWQIDITDSDSIRTFADQIGILGKEAIFDEIRKILETRKYQTNKDLIPMEIWQHLTEAKGSESWQSLAKRAQIKGYSNLHVGRRSPTRERLLTLAVALDNTSLVELASSEVFWDEIVSIDYVGDRQVYDLTIPETHNFVANDICVHNTALVLNIAQRAAVNENAVVAIFSLEMSKEQLAMRMLSAQASIDARMLRTGSLSTKDWSRLAESIGLLADTKLHIDDTPGISVLEMRAKLRRLAVEQKKLDLVIIDYLQLMGGGGRNENRQQEVSKISRDLKALAKEFGVPVIALSQLSRAPEARNPPRPMMSDLRESGSIEQDADVVAFIYRADYYSKDVDSMPEEEKNIAELIIAKQRNGPTDTIKLVFLKQFTRFEDSYLA